MKMLQFVTCFLLLLEIIASAEGIKPRSVNIALETILAFDNKNKNADIKFIDDVQSFLNQVRNVVDTKPVRRSSNNNVNWMRFTEFLRELIELLKSYDNDDLEDIFTVIDDEIRKYHYKGCKFYELVEDPSLRRYVANKLNLIKEKPAKDIRWKLDGTLQVLEDAKFDSTQTDVLDYINSLFTRDDGAEFKRILDILQTYKSKSKRTNLDLVKVVRDSIRTVIFDKYSRLNPNTRRDFKIKLETFWKYWYQPQTYNNKVWTLNMGKQNIRFFNNYKTTPINLNEKLKDVLFSKELVTKTHFSQDSKDKPKNKIFIITRDKKEMSRSETDYSHKRSDNDGSDTIPESNSDDKEYNRDLPMFGNKHTDSELSETPGMKRQTKSNQYSTSGQDSDEDESSILDVTKKSKVRHKKTKDTTSMFINVDSEQFVGPEKISYPSDFLITDHGGKSKTKPKHQNTFSYVTLYPETITTKKRRFKIESTTRKSNIRVQTIWKEKLKYKTNRHRHKQRPDINSDSDLDEEIYVGTKMPKSRIRTKKNRVKPQRPKSNSKHRHRHRHRIGKMRYTKDNNHNNVRSQYDAKYKSNTKKEHYGKSEYLKPIDDLISFKLTSQKKTREHKLHKNHKHKKNVKPAKEKILKQNYTDKSMDEKLDMYKRHKRVEPSIEEETFTKRHRPVSKPIIYKTEKLMEEKPIKVPSAHEKHKDANESTDIELESTSETQKISANISKDVIDSLSRTEDEVMVENSEDSLKTHKTIENPAESDLDYNEHEISSKVTEEEYNSVKNKLDEKSFIEDYDDIATKKHKADKDLLVNYITTTPTMEVKLNEELTSSRPRYKMLEKSVAKESFNPYYVRHKMVDNSDENKLITPKFIYPLNQSTKDLHYNIKMAEKSTEYEAEEIISKNLYNNNNSINDDHKQSKLSEEGLSIEAYESNFTKSFRKSNDLDNFTPTKRMPMRRIYLTFKPEVSQKPNTTDTKADYLLLQKNRYSTLPFWEGTTKNTRITKRNGSIPFITTTRNGMKFTYTSASTFQTTNTSSTNINNVSKKNFTTETLPYWSSAPTSSVPLTTTTTQKITATPSTKEISTFSQSDNVTLPKNIPVTNPQMINNKSNIQDYINRNIEMLERYRTNANKPSPGIIPLANINSNANYSAENFRSVLHKDLTTTPRPTKYSTITQSNLSKVNKNKPNIVSSAVDVTKHAGPTPVSIIDDIENLLNRYGLASMPPPLLNSVRNNSMSRRNLGLDNRDPNTDKSKQDLEINSDSEIFDNLLDKHEFSTKDEHFENEGDETNRTKKFSIDVQDVKSKITKFRNFHDFLTDTTKVTFRGDAQIKDKMSSNIKKQMKYFDKADFYTPLKYEVPKVDDIGIEEFDPTLALF